MRNTRWLRYGLGSFSITAAAFGAFLVACGDDDSGGGPQPDSGIPDTGGGNDSGNDSGGDAGGDAARPQVARLQLVNAATDFGPGEPVGALRVCYGVGNDAATAVIPPLAPLPEQATPPAPFPGLFIGTGGNVPSTGLDLSARVIVPYVLSAQKLAGRGLVKPASGPSIPCSEILKNDFNGGPDGGGPLVEGRDYWKLPPIPAGTLLNEKSYILVLSGCTGNTAVDTDKCGPNHVVTDGGDGNRGNLKVTVYEVDRATAIGADKFGAQFIHASAPGDAFLGTTPVVPTLVRTDGGNAPISPDGGTVALGDKTGLVQVSGVTVAADSFNAVPSLPGTAMKLTDIQAATYGANVPEGGAYANGAAFTFIAVGDPTPGTTGTRQFHYLALPNNPALVPVQ